MTKLLQKCLFVLLLITGFSVIFAPASFAQTKDGLDITISPSVLELSGNPGDVLQQKFRIRNNSSSPEELSINIGKLEAHSETGQVVPIQTQPGDTVPSWMSFESPTFTALPKEWKDVSFQIAIPKDAAFGYAFAIRISQLPNKEQPDTVSAKLVGELVLPVLLNVRSEGSKAELKLLSFKPDNVITEYMPTTFNIKLANTGNVYIKPQGDIFIRSSQGSDEATIDINANSGAILPGGTRTFPVEWSDGFLVREPVMEDGSPVVDAKGKPQTHLKINWNKVTSFRIGKYTATALVVYDNGERDVSLESTTDFWIIPYRLIGGILVSVILIVILFRIILKWYIAKEIKKRSAQPIT